MKVRTRFAPSPTGFMHIGNLRTALYAFLFAKKNEGDFILRIEDTDQVRLVEGAVEVVYHTLATAGITHDEGPDMDGGKGPYVQSERKPIYKEYAERLVELGGAYYCFCSKERLESLTDGNGVRKYDKHCLNLSKEEVAARLTAGDSYVIRQNIPTSGVSAYQDLVYGEISVDCADLEDNVLLKSDGMPTYNFANVVDDRLMEITHVIRGTEYLSSTPKYNLIYRSFGWQQPQYMHLPPIMKDAQRKLSKRYGDANFDDFIKKGYLPAAIVNYIALLGWSPKNDSEKLSLSELISQFSVEGVSKSSAIFDEAKMRWLNGLYIKDLSVEEFDRLAAPYYAQSAIAGKYDTAKFSKLLLTRVETLAEVIEKVAFIEDFKRYDLDLFVSTRQKTDTAVAAVALPAALEAVKTLPVFEETALSETLTLCAEGLGLKKGQMLWCLRTALTGVAVTPGGAIEMADILGRERCIDRLTQSIEWLKEVL